MLVGIEGGGATFKISFAASDAPRTIESSETVPTTTPQETLDAVVAAIKRKLADETPEAIGVACFGPLDLRRASKTYGFITTTPKSGWQNVDVLGCVQRAFPTVPVAFDTDVNAPAAAEAAAAGVASAAYVTMGTGVGVGLYVNGACVHGLVHPEMGHIGVARAPDDEAAAARNVCPYHAACVEGFVCSGALAARFGVPASALADVPDAHAGWRHVAYYVAQLCATIALSVSAERIVLGGGIMRRSALLLPMIRAQFLRALNGYLQSSAFDDDAQVYIVAGDDDAGALGALYLAAQLRQKRAKS